MTFQRFSRLSALLLALALTLACLPGLAAVRTIELSAADYPVTRDGRYSTLEEVAVYLAAYGGLPENFLTKSQAKALGWDGRKGNLDDVAPGCSIGGNRFGNYEGVLPDKSGRVWTECDINYRGGRRGAARMVFSNDGLIFYSGDHYATFTQVKVCADARETAKKPPAQVKKSGEYTSRDEVAAYLNQYGGLPGNYLTRSQAKALGWTHKKDNLGDVAPGCALGGDVFQNREKLLPASKGRTWYECDVNTANGRRGRERIAYSSDGLIYYSPDNFKSFTKLY